MLKFGSNSMILSSKILFLTLAEMFCSTSDIFLVLILSSPSITDFSSVLVMMSVSFDFIVLSFILKLENQTLTL